MLATVLTDNLPDGNLAGEWGLSVHILYRDKRILLDAGASPLFAENAEKLGISLEEVDYAVLSHGHYDHGDGMRTFFRKNDRAKLFLRETCREACYSRHGTLLPHYIGLSRGMLTEYAGRTEFVSGTRELFPGAYLLGHTTENLRETGKAEKMYRRSGWKWRCDDFSHEQSLVLETGEGLAVFNSCSHGGADNIVREVERAFPGKPISAMIGGFHLYNKSDDAVRAFAARLRETGVRRVYTGHCTGDRAFSILRDELGDAAKQFRAGLTIEIP